LRTSSGRDFCGFLTYSDDSGGGVTFENGAVLREGELARGIFCRLPIGIVCAAFHVVNHLAVQVEGNAQLDESFRFALSRCDAVSWRGDHAQVTCSNGRES
jgi:hypothetical protein